jgi:NAD(P)-dependent dehydrogenase (short-subunit alcohol dehydrogenase family)
MSQSLTGKTALVTGSTGGIGRATAQLLGERGARVVVTGLPGDADAGQETVEAIQKAGGQADFISADLSRIPGARELAAEAGRLTGGLDILVNNAGRFPLLGTGDTSEELFAEVYSVNVTANFTLTRALVPHMVTQGAGVVINIGSFTADKGIPGATAYTSSKAAVHQLTRIWAAEYGPAGVRVNAVVAGIIATEGVARAMAELGGKPGPNLGSAPAGRPGSAEEVASAVAFLASDDATYINGAFLAVDGGISVL